MKVSPILKFEGIRIELDVAEARKIVERGDANRLAREIEVMLGVHDGAHDSVPDGMAVAALADSPTRPQLPPGPWKRTGGGDGDPSGKLACRFCGKRYALTAWLSRHEERCPDRPS